MNAKQTKLIEQAATVDTDGEGWRKRMDAWLEAVNRENFESLARKNMERYMQTPEASEPWFKVSIPQ